MSLTGTDAIVRRSPLMFEFKAIQAKAFVPMTIEESANGKEVAGCGTVHFRLRRPKEAFWRCKCPHRCELIWRRRSKNGHRVRAAEFPKMQLEIK